jgi:hypothetical protein
MRDQVQAEMPITLQERNKSQLGDNMSAAGISTASLATHFPVDYNSSTPPHNNLRFHQDLGQLGDDLESGDLNAAEQDFSALQLDGAQTNATSGSASAGSTSASSTTAQSSNPISQAINQLSVDIQAGNLTAAQQDYSNIQQDAPNGNQSQSGAPHFNHERHVTGVNDLFDQLGQQLQSNNLSTAQQTYSSVFQNLPLAQTSAQQASDSSSVSISV